VHVGASKAIFQRSNDFPSWQVLSFVYSVISLKIESGFKSKIDFKILEQIRENRMVDKLLWAKGKNM
jgi:hypothetical protein